MFCFSSAGRGYYESKRFLHWFNYFGPIKEKLCVFIIAGDLPRLMLLKKKKKKKDILLILCYSLFVGVQHKSLAQRNDYRWNSTNKEVLGTGPGPAVFWMFYIQNVLVSILLWYSLEKVGNLGNQTLFCILYFTRSISEEVTVEAAEE